MMNSSHKILNAHKVLYRKILVECHRRNGHFEIFYWSHISYVAFWALLCLHCQVFWLWFLLPGFLLALGKY